MITLDSVRERFGKVTFLHFVIQDIEDIVALDDDMGEITKGIIARCGVCEIDQFYILSLD